MKIFQNRNIFKKLIIVFLSVLLLGFCTPKTVKATSGDEEGIGGKLLEPVMSMFVGLGDGAISLLQKLILQTDGSMIEVNTSTKGLAKILGIIVAALVVVGGIAAIVASAGTLSLAIIGPVLTVVKAGVIAGVVTFCVTGAIENAVLPDDFVLPQISLSPYEIFANQIPLFDVDFFNPMEDQSKTVVEKPAKVEEKEITLDYEEISEGNKKYAKFNFAEHDFKVDITDAKDSQTAYDAALNKSKTATIGEAVLNYFKDNGENCSKDGENSVIYKIETDKNTYKIKQYAKGSGNSTSTSYSYYQNVTTPEKTKEVVIKSTAGQLQRTISSWYMVLRDLSLVALLSVLVYVGIRIIISSTSKDKAKYKQMLVDWLVAICLLFVMHYIMSFSNILVKQFIELIDATDIVENREQLPENTKDGELSSDGVAVSQGIQMFEISDEKQVNKAYEVLVTNRAETLGVSEEETEFYGNFVTDNGTKKLYWPANNFTEQARMMLQFVDTDDGNNYAYAGIGYKLIYCVLVIYTVIFVFTYLKRTVYMAFLTLIAPLVAATYPIDKMNDGQAQAFNKWFKEYIFNLLIQPLHLILYMVLVGSAMDFAAQNIIYVVIALGFLTQGEKLLRTFFGFEKAHTPGFLAGPAGAAIMMNGFNRLLGRPPHKGEKGAKELNNGTESKEDNKINMKNLDTKSMFNANLKSEDAINNKNGNLGLNENLDTELKDTKLSAEVDGKNANNSMESLENKKKMIANPGITNNNLKDLKAKRSVIRGFKNVGRGIRMKSPTTRESLRKLAGVGTGLAGAAIAATATGIAGITSGDFGKAAQYIGAGAIGGYNFGKGIPKGIENMSGYVDDFKEGYYSYEEYEEKAQKKAIEEAARNEELNSKAKRRLEKAQIDVDEESFNNIRDICVEYGLDTANDISTVYQEVQNGSDVNDAMVKVNYIKKQGKDVSGLGHKEREDYEQTIMDRVLQNNKGIKREDAIKVARGIIDDEDRISNNYYKK
jgi:membrane protein